MPDTTPAAPMAPSTTTLRDLRRARGWSQEDLARRSGLDRTTIARAEAGRRQPSPFTVQSLARAFGIDDAAMVGAITCRRAPAPDAACVPGLHADDHANQPDLPNTRLSRGERWCALLLGIPPGAMREATLLRAIRETAGVERRTHCVVELLLGGAASTLAILIAVGLLYALGADLARLPWAESPWAAAIGVAIAIALFGWFAAALYAVHVAARMVLVAVYAPGLRALAAARSARARRAWYVLLTGSVAATVHTDAHARMCATAAVGFGAAASFLVLAWCLGAPASTSVDWATWGLMLAALASVRACAAAGDVDGRYGAAVADASTAEERPSTARSVAS